MTAERPTFVDSKIPECFNKVLSVHSVAVSTRKLTTFQLLRRQNRVYQILQSSPTLRSYTTEKYANAIRNGYKKDKLFSKALSILDSNSIYHLHPMTGFIYQNSPNGGARPDMPMKPPGGIKQLWNVVIDHAHETLGQLQEDTLHRVPAFLLEIPRLGYDISRQTVS